MIGSSMSGSSSMAAYMWASRWLTATNGTSHTRASAFAALDADEQRAHQPGADGGADRVDVVVADAGLDQGARHHGGEQLDVGPAGDLGNDAAEAGVQLDLAADHRGQDLLGIDDDRRRGLVARRLDAEHAGAGHHDASGAGPAMASTMVRPGTAASMRSRRAA